MIRALYRLVLAAGGATFAAALVALLESRAAGAAVVEAGAAAAPSPRALVLADLGALMPVALVVGLGVGVAAIALEPSEPASPAEHLARLRAGSVVERLRTAAAAPAVVLATFAWVVASAYAARATLAAGKPADAGLAIGAASVALLLASMAVAAAAIPALRRLLALGSAAVPQLLDPVVTGGLALALAAALFGVGIATGDTGGEGGFLGIFGVLKRTELDLRPAANAALIALGAYAAPVAFGRGRLADANGRLRAAPVAAAVVATALVLGLFGVSGRAATALDADDTLARAVEKGAPLGKISLSLLRRATDRDKDGFSAHFGGGDCNDRDRRVNPGAIDEPGNGVDEDCSGADTPAVAAEPEPAPAADTSERPKRAFNVVLITVDTLRVDLGFMGYDEPVSPNLDALAAKSTVFERAYSMASYTGKSVGPFMIGRYPSETFTNFSHFNTYLQKNVFVTERVHDAGARTVAGMCHWYFRPSSGLSQGFDVWDTSAIPPGMSDNDTSVSSDREADLAIKLLGGLSEPPDGGAADAGAGRFFAWFHFFDPHAQYVPHPGAPKLDGAVASKNLYDGEVWFTDKHVGRVLDFIAAQPWAADTAIVVTADHGEAFADHGMSWHGREIWESLVRVPLVVYVPGADPRRVPVKRSQIDLVPTILDLMGVPAPSDGELRGRSLLADVFLPSGQAFDERDVYIDMPAGPYNDLRRAIITGPTPGTKLIHFGGSSYQLYDLAEDPAEKHDLARDKERLRPVLERMQQLRGRLKEIAVKPD